MNKRGGGGVKEGKIHKRSDTFYKNMIKNCKGRHRDLSIAWVHCRKAYDMIPHLWIAECLTIIEVGENINELKEEACLVQN